MRALEKLSWCNDLFSTHRCDVSLTHLFQLGPAVASQTTVKIGDRVGVKWVSAICGTCGSLHLAHDVGNTLERLILIAPCLEGADALCQKVKISGYYTPGTFQQYVLGPAK